MGIKFVNSVSGTEESNGILDKTGDLLHYGLVDTVVSAGLDFANTGIALGNALGGEFDRIDTEDTIRQHISDNAADYYREHSEVISTAGLVLGSLVPGLTSAKAARAFAAGTLETKTSALATGIRKAMVPEARVEQVMTSIRNGTAPASVRGNLANLVKQNAMQNFAESAIYETATLLTMNQNSALNPEHLDYFEAIGANLGTSTLGVFLGTGLGAGLGTVVDSALLRSRIAQDQLATFFGVNPSKTGLNILMGDEVTFQAASIKGIMEQLKKIDELPAAEKEAQGLRRKQLEQAMKLIQTSITDTIKKKSVGYNFGKVIEYFFAKAGKGLEDSDNLLIGAQKVSTLKAKTPKTAIPGSVIPADTANVQPSLWEVRYPGGKLDPVTGLAKLEEDLLNNKLGTVEADALALDALGHLKAETIAELWDDEKLFKNMQITLKGPDGKSVKVEDLSSTERTKFKLTKTRTGVPPTNVSTMLNLGDALRSFSYEHDPIYRGAVDRLNDMLDNPTKYEARDIGNAHNELIALDSPQQHFANAYRMFNKLDLGGELGTQLKRDIESIDGKYFPLYQYMANNDALVNRYGSIKAVMDSWTGDIDKFGATPHMADLGGLVVKPDRVVANGAEVTIKPGMKLTELGAIEASGLHAWSASGFGARSAMYQGNKLKDEWIQGMTKDSIPELQVISEVHDFSKQPLTLGDGTKVASASEAYQLLVKAKENLILETLAGGQHSIGEIALKADVDMQYVFAIATKANRLNETLIPDAKQYTTGGGKLPRDFGPESLTKEVYYRTTKTSKEDIEEFVPRYMEIHYDPNVYNELGKREGSMTSVMSRIFAEQHAADNVVTQVISPEYAQALPDTKLFRKPGQSMASAVTSESHTSGLVASNQQRAATFEGAAAEIGRQGQADDMRTGKATHNEFHGLVSAWLKNPDAIMETSILHQSTLRTGLYVFAPETEQFVAKVLTQETAQVFADMGVQLADVVGNAYAKVMSASKFGKIFDKKVYDLVSDKITVLAKSHMGTGGTLTDAKTSIGQIEDMIVNILDSTDNSTYKMSHTIRNKETLENLKLYQSHNADVVVKKNMLAQVRGEASDLDPEVLYPGAYDTSVYKHVAFVGMKDASTNLWSTKSKGMLFAHTEEDLARQITHLESKLGTDKIEIITPRQQEAFLKARKEYDTELAMNQKSVDSSLRSEGKLFNLAPQYNPNTMNYLIDSLVAQKRDLRIQATKLKYGQEYAELEAKHEMASAYTAIGQKKTNHTAFSKQMNTLLGLKDTESHSAWYQAQEWADKQVGRAWNSLVGGITQAQVSKNWEGMSKLLENYGLPVLITKQDDVILSHLKGLPEQKLAQVIGQVNGIFAFSMLRLDAIATAVNVMGRPIMSSPAITGLLHDLKLKPEQEAKILNLTSVVNQARQYNMPTGGKLQQQAVIDYWQRPEILSEFVARGIVPDNTGEMRQLIDNISFKQYGDTAEKYIAMVNSVAEKLSFASDRTERFIKYVSARECQQVLDAIGLEKSHPLYWPTIAGHVSQIHGNYTASQRPTLFQGWAGQAIGLFQTYQFNMIQQFMKHVGDKSGAAKKMLAIQTATFGGQSMPGFQWLNEYIAERTLNERDVYSSTGEMLDTPVAEFLLYGGGSSLTRPLTGGKGIDFFSRGNLSPRSPILVPTKVEEIPAAKAMMAVADLIAKPISAMLGGQDAYPAIMEALAHNGLNRPIAGAAQVWGLRAKTTKSGITLVNYQDVDWATATTKLLGTATMNEAIATQSYYRALGYRTWRMEQLQELGSDFRKKLRNAEGLSSADLTGVMQEYVKLGGKARSFNRWMKNQYANADDSAIGILRDTLNSKEGVYLQGVLGNNTDGLSAGALGSLGE